MDRVRFAFGPAPQTGIELIRLRDGLFRDFIDGRGRGFLLAEAVARPKSFQFIQTDCVNNMMVKGAQAGVGVEIVPAGEKPVERVIEFLARLVQMAGLKILLARVKRFLALRCEALRSVGAL